MNFIKIFTYQQDNWSDLLPLAESYNNILSTITKVSLFFINKSYYLSINIYLEQDVFLFYTCKFTIVKIENSGLFYFHFLFNF